MKIISMLIFIFTTVAMAQMPVVLPQEAQKGAAQILLGERDPFQRPKYIEEMEQEEATNTVTTELVEDERVEAIRRWPIKDYKPIAVIWDVQNPKVMVIDRKGTMHLLKKNYRIGNRNGMITSINEGEIVVVENGVPNVMKIEKTTN
jgi:Tfp pilus assembly protein PilP